MNSNALKKISVIIFSLAFLLTARGTYGQLNTVLPSMKVNKMSDQQIMQLWQQAQQSGISANAEMSLLVKR